MLSILHRYVLRELLRSFVLSLGALTAFMLLGSIYKPLTHGVGFSHLARFMPYMLPYLFTWVAPASLLAACVMTYGRLSAENELTATSASGIPARYMCYPAFLVALVLTAAVIPLNDWLIPVCNVRREAVLRRIFLEQPFRVSMLAGQITTKIGGYKIYVESVDGDTLNNVVVIEPRGDVGESPGRPPAGGTRRRSTKKSREAPAESSEVNVYRARQAHYSIDDDARTIRIVLKDAQYTIVTPGRRSTGWVGMTADQQVLAIPATETEVDFGRRSNLTTPALRARAAEQRSALAEAASAGESARLRRTLTHTLTEVHLRAVLSFSILALSLVGVPLGIWMRRESRLASFAVAVIVFLLLYATIIGGEGLALQERLPPRVALWTPNAVTGAIGIGLFLRVDRR